MIDGLQQMNIMHIMKQMSEACSYLFDMYGGCENCSHKLCCKIYAPVIGDDEVERIARSANNTVDEFKKKYLFNVPVEFSNGTKKLRYMLNQIPCPFHKNGTCSFYSVRPSSCRQFPFQAGLFVVLEGIEICPTATLIAEEIREFLEKPDIKSDIVFEIRNGSRKKVNEEKKAIRQQMKDMKKLLDPLDKKYDEMGIDEITSQSFTDIYEMQEFLWFLESKGLVSARK